MKTPDQRKKKIAAGLWAMLLLAALAWAPAHAGPTSSWPTDGLSPKDSLLWLKYPDLRLAPLEPLLPPDGSILVRTRGCLECHRFREQGARAGVDLHGVGRRLDAETIERLLRNPRDVNPTAIMPRPPLPRSEALTIADFLSHLQ